MSELAKTAREAMRAKAHRMADTTDPHARVDASSWTPPEPLNTTAKTGMRPVSRQHLKTGGKVSGEKEAQRADRKPRKSGGLVHELMNRDMKAANESRAGQKHVGGMKAGGAADADMDGMKRGGIRTGNKRPHKANGGMLFGPLSGLLPLAMNAFGNDSNSNGPNTPTTPSVGSTGKKGGGSVSDGTLEGTRPMKGGRFARKSGGRTKGKTNINIVIAQPHDQAQPMGGAPPMPPPQPRGIPVPPPPPQGAGAMPIQTPVGAGAPMGGGMPPGLGGGMPPGMPLRKAGGRVHMTAGAGSGEGRLEKIKAYGKKA